ncbi:MAG: hypothetical protein BWK80_29570 [Desulfobacteraceae bacterium IS3]|nr:MAG: hypothetical protein BWK80_29570 [Desulfobacteraceae bacterium IS3]
MAKRKIFVSFDYENDRRYKFLLEAWDKNPLFEFNFADWSSQEIDSWNIPVIKAGLTRKINETTGTLIIIGEYANTLHKDHKLIGYRNWINFEIAKSVENKNRLIAVKIDKSYESPEELLGRGAKWALSFTQDAIWKAVNEAYL